MNPDLRDEVAYDRERAEQWAWRGSRELDISHRRFIRLAAGATAAVLGGVALPRRALADDVHASTWRLRIHGSGVSREVGAGAGPSRLRDGPKA